MLALASRGRVHRRCRRTLATGNPNPGLRRLTRHGRPSVRRRRKGDVMTTQTTERTGQGSNAIFETILPGRYLSVTSFKRDGTGVATPVWFVSDGARLFALTDLHSAKVRRIHRDPRVLVAPCRADG